MNLLLLSHISASFIVHLNTPAFSQCGQLLANKGDFCLHERPEMEKEVSACTLKSGTINRFLSKRKWLQLRPGVISYY